ncbi:hypothetical protein G0U57_020290 [Chelydra serpentina]|uniref:Uncharacterized protein n=1 Tax=Chelydra serpentina TaxID=8475 RepID=A0A8T1SWM8_CHESE|nr:hypothetical protein G0U57_020290 [Chelydra serpentina]
MESRKLMYAHDTVLTVQHTSLHTISCTLTQDFSTMANYFQCWKLRPNPQKTMVTTFHLNNKMANTKLDMQFCSESVSHEANPKYFGATLDWSLTFRQHLKNTRDKVRSRVTLIRKLAGTSWGSSPQTL